MEESRWRLAFLARYGRQDVTVMEKLPVSRLNELLTALIDIIKKENSINEDG